MGSDGGSEAKTVVRKGRAKGIGTTPAPVALRFLATVLASLSLSEPM